MKNTVLLFVLVFLLTACAAEPSRYAQGMLPEPANDFWGFLAF